MTAERRYPWAPLVPILERRLEPITVRTNEGPRIVHVSTPRVADLLGVHQRQVIRWKQEGLTELSADRVAVALSLLPEDVWPEWGADLLDDRTLTAEAALATLLVVPEAFARMRTCEAERCDVEFVPPKKAPHKRYCSHACQSRECMRRLYREDPEPKKAAVRAYDERSRAARNLKRRLRYRAAKAAA